MIYPIRLTEDAMRRVETARELGVDVDNFIKTALGKLPFREKKQFQNLTTETTEPNLIAGESSTAALFRQWQFEDATDDSELIRQIELALAEFKSNMNRWREENGERLIYP